MAVDYLSVALGDQAGTVSRSAPRRRGGSVAGKLPLEARPEVPAGEHHGSRGVEQAELREPAQELDFPGPRRKVALPLNGVGGEAVATPSS